MLTWGYGAFCEAFFNGQTLGKRAVSIRVVSEQGVPITGAQAVLRNLVGAVDGLVPFFYLLGLSSMLLTPRFQRLGDLAAGTMVVVEERRRRVGGGPGRRAGGRGAPALAAVADRGGPGAVAGAVRLREAPGPVQRRRSARRWPRRWPGRSARGSACPRRRSADAVLCAVYHRVFLGE